MKQLFMVLTVLLLLALPSYATAEKCDYTLTDKEIEKELNNLLEGGIYKDTTASGVFCVALEDLIKLQFKLKDGKINGGMKIALYYEKDKPMIETYISDYSLFSEDFYEMFNDGLPDFEVLKNKKLDITNKVYYENGNINMNCAVKNGIGDCTSYKENGAMDIYRPIKNYQFNGTAEVYSENGRLWATLHYNNGHLISAECINDRKNGKKWTKAEISNWENGLEVSCNYF
ncbi:hypothetical protein [Mucispirillum schaedleri]|uniref:Uncharacterized protein n=1 Tax=Mucispirillum schaedleri ASF457 TaxID=1379858 RepID=V2QC33_9BACT|nr:hypothetical protein [Mucispirillum schaedleri]MCX4361106.1 hypothetical protein [Mucispirillum schaedleri]USF24193.1 hypothetical protein N508_001275 [Mucispirillum schaedleri ASF457]SIW06103.1 conserved exported hypothetical protein [Mucispirillum schaedleri ASF457]